MTVKAPYFCCALGLLGVELYIGLLVHDTLVRPYGGDFLVVMLRYCLLRACSPVSRGYAAGTVLLFVYVTEASQYYHLIQQLGWEQYLGARLLLGTHFAWGDLLAYPAGMAAVLAVEQGLRARAALNSV